MNMKATFCLFQKLQYEKMLEIQILRRKLRSISVQCRYLQRETRDDDSDVAAKECDTKQKGRLERTKLRRKQESVHTSTMCGNRGLPSTN